VRFWPPQTDKPDITDRPMLARITGIENQMVALQTEVKDIKNSPPQKHQPLATTYKWISLEDIKGDLKGQKPPHTLNLPDDSNVALKSWRDILTACCRFVLSNNPSLPIPLPDSAGKKLFIFSYQKPEYRVTVDEIEYNGKKIYIYLNYDSNHCLKNAIYILGQLPAGMPSNAAVAFEKS
jgi:hypothetical protein